MLQGVDITQAQLQRHLVFVDGSSQLFGPLTNSSPNTSNIKITLTSLSPWSMQLAQIIAKALGEVQAEKPTLFIEGLDFLLAAGENDITPVEILTVLSSLSQVAHKLALF
jgi:hypothetical protein